LSLTTLAFDIAGLELYLPLICGARTALIQRTGSYDPAALATAIARLGVTVMQATPATWRLLIDAGWPGAEDLKALCGGEALTRELAGSLCRRVGRLWNVYGPTETTIWSTFEQVDRVPANASAYTPIGGPIANTQIYILDAQLQPMPAGMIGEIYIGGAG